MKLEGYTIEYKGYPYLDGIKMHSVKVILHGIKVISMHWYKSSDGIMVMPLVILISFYSAHLTYTQS